MAGCWSPVDDANSSGGELIANVTSIVVDECALGCFDLSPLVAVRSVRLTLNVGDASESTRFDADRTAVQNVTDVRSYITDHLRALSAPVRLDLSNNNITELSSVCGAENSPFSDVDLSNNRISTFCLEALQCLTRLDRLDFSGNLLADVGARPTAPYPADIRYLDLSHNVIRELPAGVLSFLGNLISLDLGYNLLTTIRSKTFACHLGRIEALSLAGNQILTLAESAFTGLSNLRQLNLSRNELTSVEGASFLHVDLADDCPQSPSPPPAIDNDTFDAVNGSTTWSQLDTIDLSRNNITLVDKSWFHSAISMSRVILLGHNRIRHFPRYGLERLPRLERLSLNDNALYWLDVGTFTSRTLRHIDLSRNRLKKIISMTFLFLPDIETVDLSHNELNFIYRVAFYKSCQHDQRFRVNLAHNYLTEDVTWALVTSFRHLIATQCVVELDVRHNLLGGILGNVKHVYGRHLRLMDAAYFAVWDHVTLDIRDNPMTCDCDLANDVTLLTETGKMFAGNISNAHHLNFWREARCRTEQRPEMTDLDEAIGHLTCTSLLQCPYECTCYFDRVTVVNCTRRSLIAIPYDLPPGEKRVYMSENYIMEIEDGPYLNNITYMDLSSNALIEIEHESLLRLSPSATLLLHNNVLGEIPPSIARFGENGRVTLRGNPISCACENWWLVDWLKNHSDVVVDFANVTCDNGKHLTELDRVVVMSACERSGSLLRGRSVSVLYASLAAALGLGFLCLILVTLAIHSRRRILPVLMSRLSWYRLNLEQRRDSSRDEIVLWYSPLDEHWVRDNVVEAFRRSMPLNAVCPYHQCLVQDDPPDGGGVVDGPEYTPRSLASAKCVVVVLSENFLATEWPSFEDWQDEGMANSLLDSRNASMFFLAMEPVKLADHQHLCDSIKLHAYYDITELMWLESLIDAISSLDRGHDLVDNQNRPSSGCFSRQILRDIAEVQHISAATDRIKAIHDLLNIPALKNTPDTPRPDDRMSSSHASQALSLVGLGVIFPVCSLLRQRKP
ncbi:hypothetical protein LSH36_76g06007 [Paralvinella palmiformis]|uniref:TIR domain-containing protein n=1 Tax=Paralvinella palmiformis TaxID=53620 RepID=A0AAD9K2B2_9ANNE|nr:hypothetical protein LSH36_76g06007 [Paralvinella palmiformis]